MTCTCTRIFQTAFGFLLAARAVRQELLDDALLLPRQASKVPQTDTSKAMIDPPVGKPILVGSLAGDNRPLACQTSAMESMPSTESMPGPLPVTIAIGVEITSSGPPPLPHVGGVTRSVGHSSAVALVPSWHSHDESLRRRSEEAYDPWMWVVCPCLLVPFMLLFASVMASWPAVDTATETPWLPPSLCSLGDGRFVSARVARGGSSADAADSAAARVTCPPGVHSPSALSFELPEGMQGWPSLDSNLSLVVYHGEYDAVTLTGISLHDARGRLLLEVPSVELEAFTDAIADQGISSSSSSGGGGGGGGHPTGRQLLAGARRPGRELKGGGGGGHGHSHGHGAGGRTTSAHRPATALPRYSYAPSTRTRYGAHTRRAVAAGTAVFVVHHGSGFGRYYDQPGCDDYSVGGCTARVTEALARDTITSAGEFAVMASVAFPLTLRVRAVEVQRAADDALAATDPPSLFFTLYSPTGAIAPEGAGSDSADSIRGLIWVPLWVSIYSLLKLLKMDVKQGICGILFIATLLCATGFQVQLWATGSW